MRISDWSSDVCSSDLVGAPPPMPPSAPQQTREERRFARYDRNRDDIITRTEMLSSRTKAFRKLDMDGNNLLSFEEWAVKTSDRFDDRTRGVEGKQVSVRVDFGGVWISKKKKNTN